MSRTNAPNAETNSNIDRIKEMASGNGRKMPPPSTEAVLRHFSLHDTPRTGDDAFVWCRELGFHVGYSTVRGAMLWLFANDFIEGASSVERGHRPGPAPVHYRITDRGKAMVKAIDDVLELIPLTN